MLSQKKLQELCSCYVNVEILSKKDIGRGFSVGLYNKVASLLTSEAQFLLNALPKDIKKKFIEVFLYFGINGLYIDELRKYFVNHSLFAEAVYRNPGSAEAFEILYREKSIFNPIDKYILRAKAGAQIYQRLQALKKNLPKIIRKEISQNHYEEFLVDNIGSGQGYDMIYVLKDNYDLRRYTHVRNIDIDCKSLKMGQTLVEKFELQDNFSFECKKITQTHKRNAHLVISIGMLCPQSTHNCKVLLRSWRPYIRENGLLIFNVVSEEMLIGDPLTDFIITMLGWHMDYKSHDLLDSIASSLKNMKECYRFFDLPYAYNPMLALRKASNI